MLKIRTGFAQEFINRHLLIKHGLFAFPVQPVRHPYYGMGLKSTERSALTTNIIWTFLSREYSHGGLSSNAFPQAYEHVSPRQELVTYLS